jgi:hypothetical protein
MCWIVSMSKPDAELAQVIVQRCLLLVAALAAAVAARNLGAVVAQQRG